jgi:hypothetical protein
MGGEEIGIQGEKRCRYRGRANKADDAYKSRITSVTYPEKLYERVYF